MEGRRVRNSVGGAHRRREIRKGSLIEGEVHWERNFDVASLGRQLERHRHADDKGVYRICLHLSVIRVWIIRGIIEWRKRNVGGLKRGRRVRSGIELEAR